MRSIYFLLFFVLIVSCSTSEVEKALDEIVKNNNNTDSNSNLSVNGTFQYINSISLDEGPTDLLVYGKNLYAVRANRIYNFSLENPEKPSLVSTYVLSSNDGNFGKITQYNNRLYIANNRDRKIYSLSTNLDNPLVYDIDVSGFIPDVIYFLDSNQIFIGGSNGTSGVIIKSALQNDKLVLSNIYTSTQSGSNVESIAVKGNELYASFANGELSKFSLTLQRQGNITYNSEPEHQKWGKTIAIVNSKLFWCNWGAGLATVDVNNFSLNAVISHTSFKNQFPNSEGTNVYDVAFNAQNNVLCVANGWSGLLLVNPDNPGLVKDYIDPEYFQNSSVETYGNYIYTGNISGGISGNLKGIKVFKIIK